MPFNLTNRAMSITRNELGNLNIERGDSDNLGIALCSYFESHIERPRDDPEGELGWGEWVVDKSNEALDYLAEKINERTSDPREVVRELVEALKKLSFAAQTTGGTAGPDLGLQDAIGDAEVVLNKAKEVLG